MTAKQITALYEKAYKAYDTACRRVDQHFTPQVRAALKRGDFKRARAIAGRIPEHMTKVFAYDAIREAEGGHNPSI